ncbi:3-oxoadipate enol-lactonase [Mangrovibrevibacter kandeliae]|uniref:3-oxoadipate enol-lactonase n=1 Tax=Mangrovibrevibacter kandeliae TaxID=2968473 RepID=UPI0021189EC6|nr:3-oxoadipate enol-lactonase [Aurantimonas sp. CSK15Z-1]MCQ8780848.1 3-oxoadipate enol-lactonase [Aurantimonas sp. CSK15Z-1]
MAFARVNGVVLHYRDEGRQDAPAIVFSNSLGTDLRIWDAVAAALGTEYRILRYDKRGHGLSEAPQPPYAIADHVADLRALLDHVGIDALVMVGLSVGGMIAQGLASAEPDRVRAVVLCDTAPKIGTAEMWNARIAAIEEKGLGGIAESVLERWFTPPYRRSENPDYTGYTAMLTRTPEQGYVGTIMGIRDADLTEATRALAQPVLCIVGDQDGSTPPDLVRAMAELIGVPLEVIKDAGHIPCVEQPEATTALIRRFVDRHLGGR